MEIFENLTMDIKSTHKNKILVVSDNPELTAFFQEEYDKQNLVAIAEVKYTYSANNESPEEMIALGATPIDIKSFALCESEKIKYDLIISIHCKQIFPDQLFNFVACVNLHPGFNPYNRGWFPQVFSIINKMPVGATLHVIDSAIDHGPIISQEQVAIKDSDTSLDVYRQIISVEKNLIRSNLHSLVTKSYEGVASTSKGNYNSKIKFEELCSLDLNSVGSLRTHIDLLRALSHGEYKNAYFLDGDGRKVYVSVNLEADNHFDSDKILKSVEKPKK